ncbi:diphosphomevalonate decarboxylase [Candidatus Woesebacteria bacterium RBG_13_34_9]|uniref:diphosphomevalonate decarboxylase n=1 Tax=Candidatus Woesebacteria bacterium RBG_13_34_9 TaxID=1802477 RepID=A0A1F7X553_9BACT|nr:MAG: diphosphomevalonate decarboxylase [Candidatus Woesebacteria bacterium RBG_13_34_9]
MKYKATAVSPANIAFIKFWGKKNPKINLPFNNSISMNLSKCLTFTSVEFSPRFRSDRVYVDGKRLEGDEIFRVLSIIDIVREKSNISWCVKVVSKNNFPSSAGIASSASAFSALALAACSAAKLKLSQKEISILARLGSGSASRSVIDGFAEWVKGKNNSNSYAVQIATQGHWDLRDIVAVVEKERKKKSSTEGHAVALTSPFFKIRQKIIYQRIRNLKKALLTKNFKKFGELLEEEAIELHIIAMTSKPPIFYWNKGTIAVIDKVMELREKGVLAYFTIDAGPNVHVICKANDTKRVKQNLVRIPNVLFTIVNNACEGTRLIKKHLF